MKRRKMSEAGEIINKKLIEINMTQRELASLIGTSEVYLSMIMHGERSGTKYISKIKSILKIDSGV